MTGVFLEERKEFDRGAVYRVDTYRVYTGGGRTHTGTRIESGDTLATREERRITVIRVVGYACLAAAIACTTIILQRLGRGERVLRDAFCKPR